MATGSYTLPMSLQVGSTVVWEGQQTLSVGYYSEFSIEVNFKKIYYLKRFIKIKINSI